MQVLQLHQVVVVVLALLLGVVVVQWGVGLQVCQLLLVVLALLLQPLEVLVLGVVAALVVEIALQLP